MAQRSATKTLLNRKKKVSNPALVDPHPSN